MAPGRRCKWQRYAAPDTKEPGTRILCPYGILYGGRGWLVAHVEGLPEMRLRQLNRIVSADLLDRSFQGGRTSSSQTMRRVFRCVPGRSDQRRVALVPDAAGDAARWQFHPTQNTTRETDGSLTVRFRAGGTQEMCNHLFTWGTAMTVIEPENLRLKIAELAEMLARRHGL